MYIKENNALKERIKDLEEKISKEEKSITSQVNSTKERCESDISQCSREDLCELATYGMIDKKKWKVGNYSKFVFEAKKRGLNCDVSNESFKLEMETSKDKINAGTKQQQSKLTAKERCETDISRCSEKDLCELATYGMKKNVRWKIGSSSVFVEEAKSRGLACGVEKLIKGKIRDVRYSDVKLMLDHLGLYKGKISGKADKSLFLAIEKLMEQEGFFYDDPTSSEALTFVLETYENRITRAERKKFKCDAIMSRRLPNVELPRDLYFCQLSTSAEEVRMIDKSSLCVLARHKSKNGLRWNVGPTSIYANEAKSRKLNCDVSSDSEIALSMSQVQVRLHNLGFNAGPIDGAWGRKTSKALEEFLTSIGESEVDPTDLKASTLLFDYYNQTIKPNNLNKDVSRSRLKSITIHDVGGFHRKLMKEGVYQTTIDRISKIAKANTVTLVDTLWITKIGRKSIELSFDPAPDYIMSPTSADYRVLVPYAKKNGLNTLLIVQQYSDPKTTGQWWELINAKKRSNKAFWDIYFKEYSDKLIARAKLAKELDIKHLVIGMSGTKEFTVGLNYWKSLINDIRDVGYTGKIGYYALMNLKSNWSGFEAIERQQNIYSKRDFFKLFDFIGFIIQDFEYKKMTNYLLNYKRYNKEVHIMVITPSIVGGNANTEYVEPCLGCGSIAPKRKLDFDLQNKVYKDVFKIADNPRFNFVTGINSWGYHLRDDPHRTMKKNDSMYDKSASIRGKPSEKTFAEWDER